MKTTVRERIIDLKAAATIGDYESLEAALDLIRSDDNLPASALVPFGEALAQLPASYLERLLDDEDPAIRGAACAAVALRASSQGDIPQKTLLAAAQDPVPEVREALARALCRKPEFASTVVDQWLLDETEFVRATALSVLACLGHGSRTTFEALEPLDVVESHEFRKLLVEALNELATSGAARLVLDLLQIWANRPEPNVWVITRVLSGNWTLEHSMEAIGVLDALATVVGEIRPVSRTRERIATGNG